MSSKNSPKSKKENHLKKKKRKKKKTTTKTNNNKNGNQNGNQDQENQEEEWNPTPKPLFSIEIQHEHDDVSMDMQHMNDSSSSSSSNKNINRDYNKNNESAGSTTIIKIEPDEMIHEKRMVITQIRSMNDTNNAMDEEDDEDNEDKYEDDDDNEADEENYNNRHRNSIQWNENEEEEDDEDRASATFSSFSSSFKAVSIRHGSRNGFTLNKEWTIDGWMRNPGKSNPFNKKKNSKNQKNPKNNMNNMNNKNNDKIEKNKDDLIPNKNVVGNNSETTLPSDIVPFIQHGNGNILFGYRITDNVVGTYNFQTKIFYPCIEETELENLQENLQNLPTKKSKEQSPAEIKTNLKTLFAQLEVDIHHATNPGMAFGIEWDVANMKYVWMKSKNKSPFLINELESKWYRLTIVGSASKETIFYINGIQRGISKFCDSLTDGYKSNVTTIALDSKNKMFTKFRYYDR